MMQVAMIKHGTHDETIEGVLSTIHLLVFNYEIHVEMFQDEPSNGRPC